MNRFPLILLISVLPILPVRADQLDDFCSRRAVGTVAELRHQHYPRLSEREIEIARKAAVIACIDSRTATISSEAGENVAAQDDQTGDRDNKNDEKEKKSWVEKLLDSEKKKDVSPMMKVHRTGGK